MSNGLSLKDTIFNMTELWEEMIHIPRAKLNTLERLYLSETLSDDVLGQQQLGQVEQDLTKHWIG